MFISRRTSAAAGSGTSRSKASVTAHTARSCSVQPTIWQTIAATAAGRRPQHGEPLARHREQAPRRAARATALGARAARREHRDRQEAEPDEADDDDAGHGPVRELRRQRGRRRRGARSGRGRRAGARRRSRAASRPSPVRSGRWRRRTATRASSPARAGSTAFPSRPTPKAEKTWRKRGCGSGIAWWIVRFHAQRARDDREQVEQDGDAATQRQVDEVERVVDRVPLRPAPPEHEERDDERGEHDAVPRAHGLPYSAFRSVTRRAPPRLARRRPPARRSPRAGPRCRARRSARSARARAAAPIATRRGSSARSRSTAVDERRARLRAAPRRRSRA